MSPTIAAPNFPLRMRRNGDYYFVIPCVEGITRQVADAFMGSVKGELQIELLDRLSNADRKWLKVTSHAVVFRVHLDQLPELAKRLKKFMLERDRVSEIPSVFCQPVNNTPSWSTTLGSAIA